MDEFTLRHLSEYARGGRGFGGACFDDDDDDAFIAWVTAMSPDDLEYYTDRAGWPPALRHYREQYVDKILGAPARHLYSKDTR